ncbi:hypothetical protein ACHQM5_010194 [Ranunculus cassubicifolius]
MNPKRNCSQSKSVDQMCRQDSRVHLSPEDAIAAEESLSVYCKPVELYNILERRAVQNPSFLQRCLQYKIQAKHRRRINMSISISWSMNKGLQVQSIFPLYVLLVTPVPELAAGGHSVVYCCRTRARILTCSTEFEKKGCSKANFVLPEMNKLSDESQSGKLFILLVSCGDKRNPSSRGFSNEHVDTSPCAASIGGYCLWGKIPMESLHFPMDRCATLSAEVGSGVLSTVDMRSCFLESSTLEKEQCITFKTPDNPVTMQVRANVLAQEGDGKDRSPYSSFTHGNSLSSSLPHITRMRTGNVVFNYKYYNNTLQKTEVTEDFSCAFCLAKCASFKGLRHHLCASHDLFNFEFWVTEEYQAVNVSVKNDIWRSEILTDGSDQKLQAFFFCSKPLKRTLSKKLFQSAKHVHPFDQKLNSNDKEAGTASYQMPSTEPLNQHTHRLYEKDPEIFIAENDVWNGSHMEESNGAPECLENVSCTANGTGISTQLSADPECLALTTDRTLAPMLQFAKSRKLSTDRADPRNRMLLQKRQFFHSHRAQPMEMEQVISDHDSEDEVDDDVADFEDRRMLDDFVDVTKDEKLIMHLWNSFVRKQRVLADGHIPWACEAFSRLHAKELVQAPPLFWCWRLLMIKLWNHGLLDAMVMDNCNKILANCKDGDNNSNAEIQDNVDDTAVHI